MFSIRITPLDNDQTLFINLLQTGCGIPPIVPDVDVKLGGINLEALQKFARGQYFENFRQYNAHSVTLW